MKYDMEYVRGLYRAKKRIKYIFFWGHTRSGDEVTKACFSQWYPCTFEVNGVRYYTAEQYMMAQKALLFHDEDCFCQIMEARHPKQFKALGRRIRPFSESVWDENKYRIVYEGNLAKFSQNPSLRTFLIQSGTRVLVEASPYDKIWGIGMAIDDERIENPLEWNGQNLLGFALMEVRDQLM